jgi:hypothetical protein
MANMLGRIGVHGLLNELERKFELLGGVGIDPVDACTRVICVELVSILDSDMSLPIPVVI